MKSIQTLKEKIFHQKSKKVLYRKEDNLSMYCYEYIKDKIVIRVPFLQKFVKNKQSDRSFNKKQLEKAKKEAFNWFVFIERNGQSM